MLTRFAVFRSALYARMEEISFRTALAVLTGVVAVAAVIAGVGLVMTQSPAPARPTALGPSPAAHSSASSSAPSSSPAPNSTSPSASKPTPAASAPARTPALVTTSPAREVTYPATAENARRRAAVSAGPAAGQLGGGRLAGLVAAHPGQPPLGQDRWPARLRPPLTLPAPGAGPPVESGSVIVIIAGPSGSGKTTIGTALAGQLGWTFADADTFHSAAAIAKMHRGEPLTDADRRPWLRAIGAWMDEQVVAGRSAVVTCSALRREYRDMLLGGRPEVTLVYLDEDRGTLARHLAGRRGHFFPRDLLDSQLAAQEVPRDEPQVVVVTPGGSPVATVTQIIGQLWPAGGPPG